jgi:hypothetical protein
MASGEVRGTPTLFIDGVVHLGGYDAATLMETLAVSSSLDRPLLPGAGEGY